MKRVLLAAAALLFLPAAPSLARSDTDPVISIAGDDPIMNAAIDKARSRLPVFWSELAAPKQGEHDFALKIQIDDGEMHEHFWCTDIQGDAAKATCSIGNDPELVHTVTLGQRIAVDPAAISDWMYMRADDKIVGGETIRALLPQMSPEQAAVFGAMLAE